MSQASSKIQNATIKITTIIAAVSTVLWPR
jgi:hypothetical protein